MDSSKRQENIIKFLWGSASRANLDYLKVWLSDVSSRDLRIFDELIRINHAINLSMTHYNTESSKRKLLEKIQEDRKKTVYKQNWKWTRYAALFLLFISLGYFSYQYLNATGTHSLPEEGQVTLKLGDGRLLALSSGQNRELLDKNGKAIGLLRGDTLQYYDTERKSSFNTLSVPYGKRFHLLLADGTFIHLNAGTSLSYPVQFEQGKDREVVLEGEAHFDVTKDTNHPFVVQANQLNIRVLGTRFVVSSFHEDQDVQTVLVEGAVGLYQGGSEFNMKDASVMAPGEKATWIKNQKSIDIEEVDPALYTGWLNGKLIINHLSFDQIIRKLERHYNVEIINDNAELDNEVFTASFDTEPIEQVLEAFSKSYPFDYTITANQIHISHSKNAPMN